MSRNAWIVFIIVTVGALAGLAYLSSRDSESINVDDVDEFSIQSGSEASGNIADHVYGDKNSPVVLIEYADYQCSACAAAQPLVSSIIDDYQDHIAIVIRNYAFLQPHGLAAASAVEAAGLQGKHRQMGDLLFTNQSSWSPLGAADRDERFLDYARQLELDIDKFQADRASDAVRRKIDFDKALGNKSGVSSTPTFFLNGELVDNEVRSDEAAFRDLIDDAIRDSGGQPPARDTA